MRSVTTPSAGHGVGHLDRSHVRLIGCKMAQTLGKISSFFKKKKKQKTSTHIRTIQLSNHTPGHLSQRNENSHPHESLDMVVRGRLFYFCNSQKPECPLCPIIIGDCLSKLWYIHSMN